MQPQVLMILSSWLVSQVAGLKLTDEQRQRALEVHNTLRASVSPQGANINFLTWNARLEGLAQTAADRCVFEHNYGGEYANLGENLYQGGRTNPEEIITLFFMEHLAYDFSTGQCNKQNALNFKSCGHYTQVVGSSVKEVGCAIAACPGGNLFVCEYDKAGPSPVYTAGPPCSACSGSSFCYEGLCINGTLRDILVNAEKKTVTCSLVCKNCGTRSELIGLDPSICMCSCPPGYSGYDCSTKGPSAKAPTSCSKCVQQGTPCQNDAIEVKDAPNCKCECVGNFTGPQCQLPKSVYNGAIFVKLRTSVPFCFNGKCANVPLSPVEFEKKIWPALQSALVKGVNTYCRRADKFADCCGAGTAVPSGGPTGDLLTIGDLRYVDFSVSVEANGDLGVAVFASAKSGNSLCSASAARRRRQASTIEKTRKSFNKQ